MILKTVLSAQPAGRKLPGIHDFGKSCKRLKVCFTTKNNRKRHFDESFQWSLHTDYNRYNRDTTGTIPVPDPVLFVSFVFFVVHSFPNNPERL